MSIKAIIPCAGYGTRMGMEPHESKEMLLHNGFPIIDYALDICKEVGIEPVIITRPDKIDLMKHLDLHHGRIMRSVYTPTGEMPQTMIDNRNYWGTYNILLFPDVRFDKPVMTLLSLINAMKTCENLAFGIHKIRDPQNWGVISNKMLCEKPTSLIDGALYDAWGLIGFHKYAGVELFTSMLNKGQWSKLPNYETIQLTNFKDITRG